MGLKHLTNDDLGANNGVAQLGATGKVPTSQLITTPQSFSFTRNNNDFLQENGASYSSVAKFIYTGSSILGIPTIIKANVWNFGGTSVSIQIFDVTNSLQIAEVTNVTNSSIDNIQDLVAISNIPLNAALFEVRLLLVGGGMGDSARISSLIIH
jgi:hypothetical protein